MNMKNDTLMPSQQAWELMIKLRDLRAKYKADVQDLIKARKKLEEDLRGMGDRVTDEYSHTCVKYWKVISGIEKCRAEQQFLADSIDRAIDYAATGRIFDDETLEELQKASRGEDLPLYDELVKDAGVVSGDEAIGTPDNKPSKRKPKAEAPVPEVSPEFEALLNDKGRWSRPLHCLIQDEALALLQKAGLLTLGNAFWFSRKDGTFVKLGLTEEQSGALTESLLALSGGGINHPPEGMHVEQPKPKSRGKKPAV